jgi:hypothetical protein
LSNRFIRLGKRALVLLGFVVVSSTLACGSDSLGPSLDLDEVIQGELVIEPEELELESGESSAFRVLLRTSDGALLNSFPNSGNVEWSTDKPAILSVSGSGSVNAKHPGDARVTARLGQQAVSGFVYVSPKPAALRPILDAEVEGPVGSALPDSVGVRVVDVGGLPVSGVKVRFSVEMGGGAITPAEVVTRADGSARAWWRLGPQAGKNALRVEAVGLPTVYLTAKGVSAGGDDTRLIPVDGDDQDGIVGELLPDEVSVRVVDRYGNPVSNAKVEWDFVDGVPGGAAGVAATSGSNKAYVSSDASGESSVTWQLGETSGDQRLVARLDNDYEVWFKAQAKPTKPFLVQVFPPQADIEVNETLMLAAEVRDRFGNLIPDPNLNWSSSNDVVLSVDNRSGAARGLGSGSATVTAKVMSVRGTSQVNVVSAGPATIRKHSGGGQSGLVDSELSQPFVVQVLDAGGNP